MINYILAAVAGRGAGLLVPLIVIGIYAFIFCLVIICLVRVSRYFRTAGKEQKLMRMEMSKIAEEVHLLRQELKGGENSNSSTDSG